MPTLDELKNKWFIDVTATDNFPPTIRYPGSAVQPFTDGNRVTVSIDGEDFMVRWYTAIQSMITGGNPSACEVWHTGWRFDGVETRGHSVPTSNALDVFDAADNAGVNLLGMISGHLPGQKYTIPSIIWLNAHNIWRVVVEGRYPVAGSAHQKFTCMRNPADPHCLVGSADIAKSRWDRRTHLASDPERHPDYKNNPTHELGVKIEGPAVADIETTFKARWNDPSRTLGLLPAQLPLPLITASVNSPPSPPNATHSIQVLHTYGLPALLGSRLGAAYSWSPPGEFTIWASYLNAIAKASSYVYIEDQYFLPFDWPPCFERAGKLLRTDLIYQLGKAIKRGVKLLVLVPNNVEDAFGISIKYQRDKGVEYLKGISAGSTAGGDFVIASLMNGPNSPIFVHAKVMIIDDEFVLVGNANISQRSMTCDSEMQLGIVDSASLFAKDLRKALWGEHLGSSLAAVDDPLAGYAMFKTAVSTPTPTGHVGAYQFTTPSAQTPRGHQPIIRYIIDPYAGTPRLFLIE